MGPTYGAYNRNDENNPKYPMPLLQYQTQQSPMQVGSGGNVNGQLVTIAGLYLWPISDIAERIPKIPVTVKIYGEWPVRVLDCSDPMPVEEHILTTKDKLDQIRDSFGLSISHLAKILSTSRPTLHAWIDHNVEPRDQSRTRINQIYRYSQLWKAKSKFHYSPGRLMRQQLADSPSLLERLECDHLDDAEIQNGLERLLLLMERQRVQMDQVKQRSGAKALPKQEQEKTRHELTPTISSR